MHCILGCHGTADKLQRARRFPDIFKNIAVRQTFRFDPVKQVGIIPLCLRIKFTAALFLFIKHNFKTRVFFLFGLYAAVCLGYIVKQDTDGITVAYDMMHLYKKIFFIRLYYLYPEQSAAYQFKRCYKAVFYTFKTIGMNDLNGILIKNITVKSALSDIAVIIVKQSCFYIRMCINRRNYSRFEFIGIYIAVKFKQGRNIVDRAVCFCDGIHKHALLHSCYAVIGKNFIFFGSFTLTDKGFEFFYSVVCFKLGIPERYAEFCGQYHIKSYRAYR